MGKAEMADKITDDFVAIIAIIAITFLGYHGIFHAEIIGAIAGLGGYRLYKNRKK